MSNVASLQIKIESGQVVISQRELGKLADQSKKVETQNKRTEQGAIDLGNSFSKAGAVANTALGVLGVGALGVAGALGTATQGWLEFDKAMRQVNGITTQSTKQFASMRKEVIELSSRMGIDVTEAAKGVYDALSADVPRDNVLDFIATASKAAVGGGTTTATAVNALTGVLNAYGEKAGTAEQISDKLFQTVNAGKITWEQLSQNMATATVIASSAGVSFDEVMASIVTMTKTNTEAGKAFTQTRAAISSLLNPSKEMQAVYDQLGVAGGKQMLQQYGLAGSLEKVRLAYAGNDAMLIKALRTDEAWAAQVALSGDRMDTYATALDGVRTASGLTANAFEKNSGTLEQALNSVKASSIGLIEQMESSMGIISKFSDALRGAADLILKVNSGALLRGTADQEALDAGMGILGSQKLTERIKVLKQQKADLERIGADAGRINQDGALGKRLFGGGLLDPGTAIDDKKLADTVNDLNLLQEKLALIPQGAQELGRVAAQIDEVRGAMTKLAETPSAEWTADQKAENLALTQSLKALQDQAAKVRDGEEQGVLQKKRATEAADQARAATELETQKKMEENAALKASEKEYNDQTDRAAKMAEDAALSDVERVQAKQQLAREALAAGKIDEETARKAIANYDIEIKKLEELAAKKGKGKVNHFGEGTGSALLGFDTKFEAGLPELSGGGYGETEFDKLKKQEEELQKSYDRRREIIVNSTRITEEEKLAYLAQTESQYTKMQRQLEVERNKQMVNGMADLFGNLSTILKAFGKKGAKAAKAMAIVQATIKMYESATSAYASAAAIPVYGWIAAPIAAAGALAAGAMNIAAIKNQSEDAGSYATGGIIPGTSFAGDNLKANVNSGEMILNAQQQRNLFNMANGGGTRSGGGSKIEIHNYGADVQTTTRPDTTTGQEIIRIAVNEARRAVADDIHKGGTDVARAIEGTYATPRGKR